MKNYNYIIRHAIREAIEEAWETLPRGWSEESLQRFWSSLTKNRKHKITACAKRIAGHVSDPWAFCGSLASRLGER